MVKRVRRDAVLMESIAKQAEKRATKNRAGPGLFTS